MSEYTFTRFEDGCTLSVKALRDALSRYPEGAEIRIDDADTGMWLRIEEIETHDDEGRTVVTLSGSYWRL